MFVFDNVIDEATIERYKSRIESHFLDHSKRFPNDQEWYPGRVIRLDATDPIIETVQQHLQRYMKMTTVCDSAELQARSAGMGGRGLHKHDHDGREHTDYNSLLYLHNDFNGGEFYTENGIVIEPRPGRLTFFDGKSIAHGVKKIYTNHRYTVIFWWKGTKFY